MITMQKIAEIEANCRNYSKGHNPSLADVLALCALLRESIEVIESVAAKDHPEQDSYLYWLQKDHALCAEVAANDTTLCRDFLKRLDGV